VGLVDWGFKLNVCPAISLRFSKADPSRLVIGLMYILSPIGYPIALLLDHLLGTYHEKTFTREGLKTLIMLHEVPRSLLNSRDRLHPEETSMICNVLSVSRIPISEIMTPLSNIFALSSDAILNDSTRSKLLKSGYNKVPVYQACDKGTFLGVLNVITLIGREFSQKEVMAGGLGLGELKDLGAAFQQEEVLVGDLELEDFRIVGPDLSLADALAIFKNRGAEMVVVSEDGRKGEKALGMVTFRDLMEATMSREMEIC
jgi:metal transporter CNNM